MKIIKSLFIAFALIASSFASAGPAFINSTTVDNQSNLNGVIYLPVNTISSAVSVGNNVVITLNDATQVTFQGGDSSGASFLWAKFASGNASNGYAFTDGDNGVKINYAGVKNVSCSQAGSNYVATITMKNGSVFTASFGGRVSACSNFN